MFEERCELIIEEILHPTFSFLSASTTGSKLHKVYTVSIRHKRRITPKSIDTVTVRIIQNTIVTYQERILIKIKYNVMEKYIIGRIINKKIFSKFSHILYILYCDDGVASGIAEYCKSPSTIVTRKIKAIHDDLRTLLRETKSIDDTRNED